MTSPLNLGVFPGATPRLLIPAAGREGLAAYMASGGYDDSGLSGRALIDEVESAGLRGRGGAAFPCGVKLRSVADRDSGPRFVLCNGEEGEPASVKDRWLMRTRPHLVLDGAQRAAQAIGASAIHLYVSDPPSAASLGLALGELGDGAEKFAITEVSSTYVAGEETAAVRAINGGPAKPTDKPPRPFEAGIDGWPTLVLNAETIANLPGIATQGADCFREAGSERSPGTFLLTLSGACRGPGLYEVPLGVTLEAAIAYAGGADGISGFLMGGFFAGLLSPRGLLMPLGYDELRDEGAGLGCGAVIVLGPEDCPVAAAADVMSYFARENADQCGACIKGTDAMRDALFALGKGEADEALVARLMGWSQSLRGRGACALLDGAAHLASSLFREFGYEVERHLHEPCETCAALLPQTPDDPTRFALDLEAGFAGRSFA